MLAVNGNDQIINIFDKRGAEIVKTFHGFHSLKEIFNRFMYIYSYLNFINILGDINCVRWNQRGDMLASACSDQTETAGLQWTSMDFKTGKLLYLGITSDRSNLLYLITHSSHSIDGRRLFSLLLIDIKESDQMKSLSFKVS